MLENKVLMSRLHDDDDDDDDENDNDDDDEIDDNDGKTNEITGGQWQSSSTSNQREVPGEF